MLVSSVLCPSVHNKTKILIYYPFWFGSERWRYLWNWGDIPVMTMMSLHVHASLHTCLHLSTLLSGMLRPISQPIAVRLEISRYLENQEIMLDLTEHII